LNTIFGAVMGPLATYVLSILGLAGAAGYAIFRLNSTQMIREKVWSSFVGDKDFNDEKLKSFSCDQIDLARFRVVYGVPARSINDLHHLLLWMDQNQVSPIDVKRIRRWIDPSRDEPLGRPSKRYVSKWFAALVILSLCVVVSVTTPDSRTTLFKMKVSGTWFSSDGTSVNAVWGRWRIDAQSCMKHTLPDTNLSGLTGTEAAAICDGIAGGELKTMVSDALKYQHRGIAVILFFILLAVIGVWHRLKIAVRARELGNQLRSRENAPSEQPQRLLEANPVEL
jgi:Family of unknown function (DUF6216)